MDIQTGLNDLAVQSVETLKAYFDDTEPDKRDETRAKIAASVLSSTIRYKQTQGVQDALRWSMATV